MRNAVRPAAGGLALAAGMILFVHWPAERYSIELLACFLALTACVYPGALLAQSAPTPVAAAELAIGAGVFVCAVLALTVSPLWLVVGYVAHGGWDWLHHSGHVKTQVAQWFPPACALYDFAIAFFVVVIN